MKVLILITISSLVLACNGNKKTQTSETAKSDAIEQTNNKMEKTNVNEIANNIALPSIHQFKIDGLSGGQIDFATYKGKKILVVNTASECGYTKQYKGLQELSEKFKDKLVIVGIPANNFGGQEPGTGDEIKTFCEKNYGVSFPMAAKLSAKGDDIAPIFKWLCNKSDNQVSDGSIKWNFTKFLLDENGTWVANFPSGVEPMSAEITGKL